MLNQPFMKTLLKWAPTLLPESGCARFRNFGHLRISCTFSTTYFHNLFPQPSLEILFGKAQKYVCIWLKKCTQSGQFDILTFCCAKRGAGSDSHISSPFLSMHRFTPVRYETPPTLSIAPLLGNFRIFDKDHEMRLNYT